MGGELQVRASAREPARRPQGWCCPRKCRPPAWGLGISPSTLPRPDCVDPKDVSFTDLNIRLLPRCDLHGYEKRGDRYTSPTAERHGGR